MFRLSSIKMISAAHVLRDYEGPCARLHGHNWNVKIEVISNQLNKVGFCIDFRDLDDILWKVIGPFDHNNFNEFAPFDKINPTAENIAKYFYYEVQKILPEKVNLEKISVWETDNYLVEYFETN